jgi:hypothetical protein
MTDRIRIIKRGCPALWELRGPIPGTALEKAKAAALTHS